MEENQKKQVGNTLPECKVILSNQSKLEITGVTKVLSSTESQICILIGSQEMTIEGEKLLVEKIDIDSGLLNVNGLMTCLKYNKSRKKENFIKRIFG